MGSTIVFDALANNTVDVYVGYTGTIWSTVLKETNPISRIAMRAAVAGRLYDEYGIVLAGALGFENTYALVARRETLQRYGLTQIENLAPVAKDLRIGGDPEFLVGLSGSGCEGFRHCQILQKSEWIPRSCTRRWRMARSMLQRCLSDGRIEAFDLAVLNDPKEAFPPYDAVLLCHHVQQRIEPSSMFLNH